MKRERFVPASDAAQRLFSFPVGDGKGVFLMRRKGRIRRIAALTLCMVILMPWAVGLAATATVNTSLLRLRESASTLSRVLDAYPKGTTVTVLKAGDSWTKVSVRGKTGYMMTRYLKGAGLNTGTDKAEQAGSNIMYVKTDTGNRLNLRDGPGTEYDVIGSYRQGTAVTVLKRGKYWTRVSVGGKTGYMGSQYLSSTK